VISMVNPLKVSCFDLERRSNTGQDFAGAAGLSQVRVRVAAVRWECPLGRNREDGR
jgi:hypothetical protein